MKIFRYIIAFSSVVLALSCTKHELKYDNIMLDEENTAEFQLHYFEPILNKSYNYIDSVFVNGVLYSSVEGSGQLLPYNGVPGGDVGKFFAVKKGMVNFRFYRGGEVCYDQNVELNQGKQNVFVYDLDKAPMVIKNGYPYIKPDRPQEQFGTDSIAFVSFYNFMYEDEDTPYEGKILYQWKDPRKDGNGNDVWRNIGDYVGFGEAAGPTPVKVVKDIYNSSGKCKIYYRILDEKGDILQVTTSRGAVSNYSDWWNAYIGRAYMHILCGIRTKSTPYVAVKLWTSL